MAEKKINNAEVMTEEQLDKVVGGWGRETKELQDLLKKAYGNTMDISEIREWIHDNLNITARIFGDFDGVRGPDNIYERPTGKSIPVVIRGGIQYIPVTENLTHKQVVAEVKKYLGIN